MNLLVNAPSGEQQKIVVGATGGYFDPDRVLWDERVDGPLPEITLGGMVRVNGDLVFDQSVYDSRPIAPVAIPQVVSMAQARKALVLSGISIALVDLAIADIEDDQERELAQTDWEYSTTVRRESPLIASLSPALGLTSEQVDNLFILADTL